MYQMLCQWRRNSWSVLLWEEQMKMVVRRPFQTNTEVVNNVNTNPEWIGGLN